MDNEGGIAAQSGETEIATYRCLSRFREQLLSSVIGSLGIPAGSRGLDAGCGIGSITRLLSVPVGRGGHVTGLDISRDLISYARDNHQTDTLHFVEGDITSLQFDDGSFDWVWSIDTVWPGPRASGCPSEDPRGIIGEFHRVLRPGGSLFILFWTSQRLLPGYPVLEALLNATSPATAPFCRGMGPSRHVFNAGDWLESAGFKNIAVKTYTGDIAAPLSGNDREALHILLRMFWGESEPEISGEDWKKFMRLCDPESDEYILNNRHYYGFYTYSLFRGMK
ncbi:MAG: class I SAM-dependent methyltransferase [Spirochaetes bacterium]|nr:class I SAM-dependent methyltransferase [Spirochaetota bacterium]